MAATTANMTAAKNNRATLVRKRDLRGDMNGKLIALLCLIGTSTATAQLRVEGEVSAGPTIASRDAGDSVLVYPGLCIGSAANLTLLSYGVGEIRATITPSMSLGQNTDREMDLQRFHLPIGVMLTVGDNVRDQYGAINGAVTIGYGLNFGTFADNGMDTCHGWDRDVGRRCARCGKLQRTSQ